MTESKQLTATDILEALAKVLSPKATPTTTKDRIISMLEEFAKELKGGSATLVEFTNV